MPSREALARADGLAAEGRLRKAAETLAAALGRAGQSDWPDFRPRERDPRQDMQYGESLALCEDPAPYRRVVTLCAAGPRRGPGTAAVSLCGGAALAMLGRFSAARAALEPAARRGSGWALAWRGVARSLEKRRRRSGALAEALRDLDAAVSAGPDSARLFAFPWRAELRHDCEDLPGALDDLAELLRAEPGQLWARVERGEILCELGRAEEALGEFERLAREHPKAAWARALRGRTLATTGRERESLKDLRAAVDLAPASAAPRAWLAESLRKLGRYAEAREQLDRAVGLEPGFTLAWVWRGRLKLLGGDLRGALNDLSEAIRLDARYRLAFAWRGEALFKLGRRAEAGRDFARLGPLDLSRTWNPRLREGQPLTPELRSEAFAAVAGELR